MRKLLKKVLPYLPLLGIWWYLALAVSVFYSEGWLNVLPDAYGNRILVLGGILAAAAVSAPLWLRILVKKEWRIALLSYLLTIALIFGGILTMNFGEKQFETFTPEKWRDYPTQRISMLQDLMQTYHLIGLTEQEVQTLLGTPDEIYDDRTYVYQVWFGNHVYVAFEDGCVIDCYAID